MDYVAPEILNNESLNNKSDMWAVGVSVFCMLVGYLPFFKAKDKDTIHAIRTNNYEFDIHHWSYFSKEAQDFIERLL